MVVFKAGFGITLTLGTPIFERSSSGFSNGGASGYIGPKYVLSKMGRNFALFALLNGYMHQHHLPDPPSRIEKHCRIGYIGDFKS